MELFGYIDPGTGSLFIQAVLGVALAVTVALRGFIKNAFHKVKLAFSRQSSTDEEN